MAGEPANQFVRPEHQAIIGALQAADAALLARCRCWFGGGTAIVLDLREYRLSKDVDFLCADQDGYRALRSGIAERGASFLFGPAVTQARGFRADQYGIRGVLAYAGHAIRFEIVRESRISLEVASHRLVPVMGLTATDRVAEKLLANADRGRDPASASRDAVDLGMIAMARGDLPKDAAAKAVLAYGQLVQWEAAWVAADLHGTAARRRVGASLGMKPAFVDSAALHFCRAYGRLWPEAVS